MGPEVTSFNPLTPGAFCKKCVFGHFVVFWLNLGQIIFNPVENAFATQQLALLATGIAFYRIETRAKAEIQIFLDERVTYVFRLFDFWNFFFAFPFSPFPFFSLQ